MEIKFYDLDSVPPDLLKFAVICANYKSQWVFVRHKHRKTFEVPGGHREPAEHINDTARRELFEETGALEFQLIPVCEYAVITDSSSKTYGRLFYGDIYSFGQLPNFEIEEIILSTVLPDKLTYQEIQPHLMAKVIQFNTRLQ